MGIQGLVIFPIALETVGGIIHRFYAYGRTWRGCVVEWKNAYFLELRQRRSEVDRYYFELGFPKCKNEG